MTNKREDIAKDLISLSEGQLITKYEGYSIVAYWDKKESLRIADWHIAEQRKLLEEVKELRMGCDCYDIVEELDAFIDKKLQEINK